MNNFIKALYADLLHRIDVVIADIKGLPHHPDIKDRFIDDTINQFSFIRNELQSAIDTGILEVDLLQGITCSDLTGSTELLKVSTLTVTLPSSITKNLKSFFTR
jgi:hypothetical protein